MTTMQMQRDLIAKLAERLVSVGVCPECLAEYVHEGDEPFAHCDCPGTIEWTGEPPLLWSLRQSSGRDERTRR